MSGRPAATQASFINSNGILFANDAVTVFINAIPAAMVGTIVSDHAPYGPPHPPHVPNPVVTGSATVFIEGRPAARVGDLMACGHVIVTGIPNVLIGG